MNLLLPSSPPPLISFFAFAFRSLPFPLLLRSRFLFFHSRGLLFYVSNLLQTPRQDFLAAAHFVSTWNDVVFFFSAFAVTLFLLHFFVLQRSFSLFDIFSHFIDGTILIKSELDLCLHWHVLHVGTFSKASDPPSCRWVGSKEMVFPL